VGGVSFEWLSSGAPEAAQVLRVLPWLPLAVKSFAALVGFGVLSVISAVLYVLRVHL